MYSDFYHDSLETVEAKPKSSEHKAKAISKEETSKNEEAIEQEADAYFDEYRTMIGKNV